MRRPIFIPPVMPVAAFLAIVGDFQPYAVGIRQEGSGIVWGVIGIEPRFRRRNAGGEQLPGNVGDIGRAIDPQTQMMQAGMVGVMAPAPGGAQYKAEMAVVYWICGSPAIAKALLRKPRMVITRS